MVAALAAGSVPRENPTKIWAGNGTGSQCAICGSTLTPTDVEYEGLLEAAQRIAARVLAEGLLHQPDPV